MRYSKFSKIKTVPSRIPSGSSASFPLAAQYQFGGTYSKVELPVIECGGTIELSR